MAKRTRIFFATDIHGSDTCFKKFVNAGQFYKAQVLVLGGDITGKVLISIVKRDDGKFFFNSPKREPVVATDKELEQHEQNLAAAGYYPYRLPPSEAQEFNENREFKDKVFHGLILDRLRKWVEIADTRLASSGIKCYVQGGNDDSPEIDDVLKTSKTITIPERKVVMIDDSHEMISTGYTNMTPWKCPKDIPDEELGSMIEEMAKQVKNMKSCVFNFHCPPYDSGLDIAPALDANLTPEMLGGELMMKPCGSPAVRAAIEKYQPLLGLHGHVHESHGYTKIGRTLCLNPGSEYTQETLRGYIVDLEPEKINLYQPVQG